MKPGDPGVPGAARRAVPPRIRIAGTGAAVEGSRTVSILNILLRGGVGIDTVCGGRAQCGRDLIRIVSGAQWLSPMREMESRRLAELGAAGDMRLACQTYARGDVEIEVIHWAGKGGT